MFKSIKLGVVALLLAACTAPGSRHATPQNPGESPAAPPLHGRVYRIDESRSELRILVYRAGPLAHLGHNHVMVNRSIHGVVNLADSVAETQFSMEVPVAAFVVDDAQARSEEGEDFPGDVPDDAKSGTWNNMTGPAVLNSVRYPVISMRSVRLEELQGTPTATVAVSVAGHESTVTVPFILKKEVYGLSAMASFELRQTAVGITPFSLMLGALAVRDAMQVKLKVIAQLEAPR